MQKWPDYIITTLFYKNLIVQLVSMARDENFLQNYYLQNTVSVAVSQLQG